MWLLLYSENRRLWDAKHQVLERGTMKPFCTRTDAFLVFNYLQLSLFVRVAKPQTKLFTRITKTIVVELLPCLSDAKDQVLEGGVMKPFCTRTDAVSRLSLFVRVAKPKTKLFTSMTEAIVVELEFADDMIMVFTKLEIDCIWVSSWLARMISDLKEAKEQVLEGGIMKPFCTRTDVVSRVQLLVVVTICSRSEA
ncbi:hypothetical protein pdam_00018798 [Pocillopora damicornis]|uniref:Uncharacterized protein n=1 Tax=Pocillopora damicornis TaxID=46731 RepID=A0A3M6V3D1_POCDA|nr:hypothetical protein pdam_00018798 [Pocillopora damicornis]